MGTIIGDGITFDDVLLVPLPACFFAQKETAPSFHGSVSFLAFAFLFFRLIRMGVALSFQVLSCFDLVEFIKDIII